jgi:glycosyltransferase involved in cell wall biosynthesis
MERYFKFKNVPVVNMIRNMWPLVSLRHAELREKVRIFVQRMVAHKAVQGADKVIAVSGYVKDYLRTYWHIPEERVQVIYHGVEKPKDEGAQRPSCIPSQFDKFLFTAGSIDPYRGMEDIFGALGILKIKGSNYPLVIAGEARPAMKRYLFKLKKLVKISGLEKNVCWTGSLSENEMAWCYEFCAAMIVSSRVEACPNIALEAMAYGCPTVAAGNPPLPEFFKETAFYYIPGKADSLAVKVQQILDLKITERLEISGKLKNRAADFSWDSTAQKTIAELVKAADKN